MKISGLIEDVTSDMPLDSGSDMWPLRRFVFVCLLAGLLKNYERILMKFSGKIEDGTSNEPLNFGIKLLPYQRFALSECTFRAKICALRMLLVCLDFVHFPL